MIKNILIVVFLFIVVYFLIGATKTHAWYYTYRGNELSSTKALKYQDELTADYNTLPKCMRKIIDKHLKKVVIRKGYEKYPQNAESWYFGMTVVEVGNESVWSDLLNEWFNYHRPIDNEFIHEMCHQYDWGDGTISNLPEWKLAVNKDFEIMTPKQRSDNEYLKIPREAFAELCAAKFNSGDYYNEDGHFNIELFVNTRLLLNRFICKDK
jgi:hypothetical protein